MTAPHYFVTGYPGFIGKRLVPALLARSADAKVSLLVQPKMEELAKKELAKVDPHHRVKIVTGDVVDIHLGLSSKEYRELTDEVTDIFHLAALYYQGVDARTMRNVNVEGTRNALELAADARHLARFNHMSTSVVSGARLGVIEEDELDEGQKFRSPYEESKFEAEKLVRAASATLPVTVYRPGIVVGDSKTGEIDRFDGPYYLAILLVTSPAATPLPLPGSGVAPLNVVPIDFVIDAILQISHDPRAIGRTFHLVDPNPMAARKVYEWIAAKAGKKLPPIRMSYRMADKLLQIPVLERLVREERQAIASVNHLAIYTSRNTLELLDGTGIHCPRLTDYIETLLAYVTEYYKKKRESPRNEGDSDDPLQSAS